MKINNWLLVLLALTTTFIGCDKDPTDNNTSLADNYYESSDPAGTLYILSITEKTSRAAHAGDSYVLTIKQMGQPDKESKGSVSTIGADGMTMKPTKADSEPFGVSVSKGKMTAITGIIPLEDGEEFQAPDWLMPIDKTFTGVEDMAAWLKAQPANTPSTFYGVKLNIAADRSWDIRSAIRDNDTKYIGLDISGSTFIGGIGGDDFGGCTNLICITIPNNSITRGGAFLNCSNLTAINVTPDNSEYSSHNGVLYDKDKTALYTYPAGKKGKSFTIPDGVTSIGDAAFHDCSSLVSITIPDSVTSIGNSAFRECAGLTGITIPNGVTSIEQSVFDGCTGITNITIPNSVNNIGRNAFRGTSLTNITIPDSVTNIGPYAFEGTGLTGVTIPNGRIEGNAFDGCTRLTSVTIGSGVTGIGSNAFRGTNLSSLTIRNGITGIGNWAFAECAGLIGVTIPDSVTSIGVNAFLNCTGLTSVTIGSGVTSIGQQAFGGCTRLSSVKFESAITSENFNNYAFLGLGDLRAKYLAANGGIGTYTSVAPLSGNSVWTKQ